MPLLLSTSNRLNYNSLPHSPSPAGAVGEKMCVEAGKSAATSDLHQLLQLNATQHQKKHFCFVGFGISPCLSFVLV